MEWDDEAVAKLRHLWGTGLSTAQIGRDMGVSKNAVVGKAHRLNLPSRPSPIAGRPGGMCYRGHSLREAFSDDQLTRLTQLAALDGKNFVSTTQLAYMFAVEPRDVARAIHRLVKAGELPESAERLGYLVSGSKRVVGTAAAKTLPALASAMPLPSAHILAHHIEAVSPPNITSSTRYRRLSVRPVVAPTDNSRIKAHDLGDVAPFQRHSADLDIGFLDPDESAPAAEESYEQDDTPRLVLRLRAPTGKCEWPMWGNAERPTHEYCGTARHPGTSYCQDHCRVAFSNDAPERFVRNVRRKLACNGATIIDQPLAAAA